MKIAGGLATLALVTSAPGCGRGYRKPPGAPPPAAPATPMNANTKVLDHDGFCSLIVNVQYAFAASDAATFERPVIDAIAVMDKARAKKSPVKTLVADAHAVRKAYAKLLKYWYDPMMEFTGGPFRCRTTDQHGELSSDVLFKNIPKYRAYVDGLSDIPGKYEYKAQLRNQRVRESNPPWWF